MKRGTRDSRLAILHAATAEFAARGFAGAGVDRIARAAGVNKAMIYYHFRSKARLYQDIVRDMFGAIGTRTAAVAASTASPAEKIDAFIEAFASEAAARPHIPPIMMREAAEGARHLDADSLRAMLAVFASLRAILAEGARNRAFKPVDPVLMYFALVGPIVMYLATAPVRSAIGRLADAGAAGIDPAPFARHLQARGDVGLLGRHLQETARHMLEQGSQRSRAARLRRRATPRATSRTGEHA